MNRNVTTYFRLTFWNLHIQEPGCTNFQIFPKCILYFTWMFSKPPNGLCSVLNLKIEFEAIEIWNPKICRKMFLCIFLPNLDQKSLLVYSFHERAPSGYWCTRLFVISEREFPTETEKSISKNRISRTPAYFENATHT